MINDQNMYGKSERTGKHKKIALLQREGSVCHAEQIETGNGNENCEPDLWLYSFSEEQAADRNKYDVKCGDKPGCRVEATNSAMPQRIPPAQSVFDCVPFSDEASGGRVRFLHEEKKTISGRSVSPPSRFRAALNVKGPT